MAVSRSALSGKIARARDARDWLSAFEAGSGQQIALLLIGIRDLKQINELHGHSAGNLVIQRAGQRIRDFARGLDHIAIVARMPGREFLMVLRQQNGVAELENIARKLIAALSGDLGSEGQGLHISPRIGIAISESGETGTALHQRASAALAKAYARKGKKLAFADPGGTASANLAAMLDRGLRQAIAERQIVIMLQPQFAVANGHLVGAEALARWHHPELGEIGATQLFAAADRCDLREELSHLIQQEAIAIAAAWPAALDDLRLAVNLGAEELGEGYSTRLLGLLTHSGFPPERLTIELTEESLVRDIELASAQLEYLRESKIRIAVDDFGTGYSSLAYLKALPLDYLKLDKGMTPDISGTGKDRIVLRAIIAMGKALGLQIIAEGVESESELAMLRAEDCDYFQGFLRSPPLSAEAFERFALLAN